MEMLEHMCGTFEPLVCGVPILYPNLYFYLSRANIQYFQKDNSNFEDKKNTSSDRKQRQHLRSTIQTFVWPYTKITLITMQ